MVELWSGESDVDSGDQLGLAGFSDANPCP